MYIIKQALSFCNFVTFVTLFFLIAAEKFAREYDSAGGEIPDSRTFFFTLSHVWKYIIGGL